jgi:hypothetical protein
MPTDLVALDLARDLIQRRIDEAQNDRLADQLPSAALANTSPSGLVAHLLSPLSLHAALANRLSAVRHVTAGGLRDLAVRVDPCGTVDHGYVLATRSR